MATIAARKLFDTLATHPALATARRTGQLRPEVVLTALASVESGYRLDALGDGGKSIGLWQVHTPSWPGAPGAAWKESLEAQIQYVRQVIENANTHVAWATRVRMERRKLGKPDEAMQSGWYNVVWQYGPANLQAWLNEASDHSPLGFAGYLLAEPKFGKSHADAYRRRAAKFASAYAMARAWAPAGQPLPPGQDPPGTGVWDKAKQRVSEAFDTVGDAAKTGLKWQAGGAIALLLLAGLALFRAPSIAKIVRG